jgi:hypothetical protein
MAANLVHDQLDLLPDDVLVAILVTARRRGGSPRRLSFRGHDSALQGLFHELSQDPKFPLLGCFVFSDSGPLPYSPALNESVSTLQLAGLIGRENPDYEILFLRASAETYFEEVLKDQLAGQGEQLEQLAAAFLERVELT